MNQTLLIGRLAFDPEVKELENDKKVCNLVLAVSRSYKNADGIYETDFIKCSLWNNIAISTSEYCKKGDVIAVKGRLQIRAVETEHGKHEEMELIAEKVTFLSNAKEKENLNNKDLV